MELCDICAKEPYSHSFKLLQKRDDSFVYYTCVANAKKYNDENGIVYHYTRYLDQLPTDKKWVWLFDCSMLDAKHLVCYNVGVKLCELFDERIYGERLEKIVIMNPNMYVHMIYILISPFLSRSMAEKIVYDYDHHSVDYWLSQKL